MAKQDVDAGNGRLPGGVQSIARAFDLLETMADLGGIVGLSQLASRSGLPLPTIHRLMRTLLDLGYVRQEPSREYALGPRLVRLGENASRLLSDWSTRSARAPTWRCSTATRWCTRRRCPAGIPCACSPRWAGVPGCIAPQSARRCWRRCPPTGPARYC